ncbi:hypothetical protein LTR36_005677 [Oleoguttula mirabilis]|uniref:DNA-directed RNA polymerase III subunit RPC6 n=1 Tax=Oleoguttula mirabilis TaxID=1507867 RepID=A0AAV9JDR7_9PEZI|nr:hypothetical protein LTR36_005677 [Oleoguttula mirabilis]
MAMLAKLSDEGDALYVELLKAAQNSQEGLRKVFFQSEVQALVPDSAKGANAFLPLVQELTNHSLLRPSKLERALCWSTRPRDAAKAITLLNADEKMLYSYVEDAHQKGIWLRELKKRTNINQAVVQKTMGKLEAAHLVKSIKNIRAPLQKTYMLYHLVPSDDVTGGSFFDAGDLDESLIEELSNLIIFHVRMQSWADTKPKRVKREASPAPVAEDHDTGGNSLAAKKRKRGTADIEDSAAPARRYRSSYDDNGPELITQLSFPAYTRTYPSAEAIHAFITTTDAIRASKAAQLTVPEIQGVIDVLVWDDKLEKVGGGDGGGSGYRTVRGVKFKPPGYPDDEGEEEGGERFGNGLTQAPCGKCPVFDLCGEGAPVNASSCLYWAKWLEGGG